jgi:hypothetical protein
MVEVATPSQSNRPDAIQRKGCFVKSETPKLELERLRRQQAKSRTDEVFGGFSSAERADYDVRQDRIHKLEDDLSEVNEQPQRERDVSWNRR